MTQPESSPPPETSRATAPPPPEGGASSVWPYVLPFVGFLAMTALEDRIPKGPDGSPSPALFVGSYALKLVVVSALLWFCRSAWRDLRPLPDRVGWVLSVALGIAVLVVWVGIDGWYPEIPFLGKRTAFDPGTLPPAARSVFLPLRFLGLVVLVPVMEELFYRAFLIRWVVDPDFEKVPIGTVTPAGVAVTTALFGGSHPEWLPAILTSLAWAWLLARTKSVTACVVSHAVANLGLGIYVLVTGAWRFW